MNQPTIHFTETMRGGGALLDIQQANVSDDLRFIHNTNADSGGGLHIPEDPVLAHESLASGIQKEQAFPMEWRDLVVSVNTKMSTPDGGLSGTIDAGTIQVGDKSIAPMHLERGYFTLLPAMPNGERRMRYYMYCRAASDNRRYLLYGFKKLAYRRRSFLPLRIWKDTTTLHVTIYELTDQGPMPDANHSNSSEVGKLVAAGVIYIHLIDFMKQLTTFQSTGVASMTGHVSNYGKFVSFFVGALRSVYFSHFPISTQVKAGTFS